MHLNQDLSDCRAPSLYHYTDCVAPLKKLVGVLLRRKVQDFLIYYIVRKMNYYIVRKMKGGLEIGQGELRKSSERQMKYKNEGKVLNCHCNIVMAYLSLLP